MQKFPIFCLALCALYPLPEKHGLDRRIIRIEMFPKLNPNPRRPVSVPVPFLRSQVGIGDVVASLIKQMGIQPCPPCEQRRKMLNALMQLRPR